MASIYDKQNIPRHLHVRMKNLADLNNNTIIQEYENAIESWLAQKHQEIILADSQILSALEARLTKMEDRLVKMNGRMGMDVAMNLVGMLNLLSREFKVPEEDIYNDLRALGAKHYSRSRKESNPEM